MYNTDTPNNSYDFISVLRNCFSQSQHVTVPNSYFRNLVITDGRQLVTSIVVKREREREKNRFFPMFRVARDSKQVGATRYQLLRA